MQGVTPAAQRDLPAATLRGDQNSCLTCIDVVVPPYPGMQAGDRIVLLWGSRRIGASPVPVSRVGLPTVVSITAPLANSETLPDIQLTWQFINAAGEWSVLAPVTLVPLTPAADLPPAPWVEDTHGDKGAQYTPHPISPDDLVVRVEGHGAVTGDSIVVHLHGTTAVGGMLVWSSLPRTVRRPNQTIDFDIPPGVLAPLGSGTALVGYEISKTGYPSRQSLKRRLSIGGYPSPMPAPMVAEVDGAVLDPNSMAAAATVLVPAWPALTPDDICELAWVCTPAQGAPVHFNAVAKPEGGRHDAPLYFSVPAEEFTRHDRGLLRITYRVRAFADIEWSDGLRRECVGVSVSESLELRIQKTAQAPVMIGDDLNDLTERRVKVLRRPYFSVTAVEGNWYIRGKGQAIEPFQSGPFLYTSAPSATARITFAQACTSVRFGYAAGGPGGNGSAFHVDVLGTADRLIGELAYNAPKTGIPGLWVTLNAADFGEPINAIVFRKRADAKGQTVSAQLDNFSLSW